MKNELRKLDYATKMADAARLQEEYNKFKFDEEQAKKDKFNKNRAHLDLVMKQAS